MFNTTTWAGSTRLEQYRANGAPVPPITPVPIGFDYLWDMFHTLSGARIYSEGGAQAITYAEIKSYADLTGLSLRKWDVETLVQMDRTFMHAHSLELKNNREQSSKNKGSSS